MTFPQTKLGIFPENFKLIPVTGAVPAHRSLGGPIRKVSLLGEHYAADALWLFAPVLQTATEAWHGITYTQ